MTINLLQEMCNVARMQGAPEHVVAQAETAFRLCSGVIERMAAFDGVLRNHGFAACSDYLSTLTGQVHTGVA